MVYFARSSTVLMMRLPICNQNQKVALEGMDDYMNMMSHFLGEQVRDRDPNNMTVIVPVKVFRLVCKYREVQSLVRTLFTVGRMRGLAEASDNEPRRSDSSGTPVRGHEEVRITPARLANEAEGMITPVRLSFEEQDSPRVWFEENE